MPEPRYFLISGGDEPQRICFSLTEAKDDGARRSTYIDVFDGQGQRMPELSLKFVDGKWTSEF